MNEEIKRNEEILDEEELENVTGGITVWKIESSAKPCGISLGDKVKQWTTRQ